MNGNTDKNIKVSGSAIISPKATIGNNCIIEHNAVIHDNVFIGDNSVVENNVTIGHPLGNSYRKENYNNPKTIIGQNCIIRTNSVIYCGVNFADNIETGTNVIIREFSSFGEGSFISTLVQIQNNTIVGKRVNIRTNAHITAHMIIEDDVFVGSGVITTNDNKMLRSSDLNKGEKKILKGAILKRGCRIGSNSTILPNLEIGENTIIAAGSVVRKSIPANNIASGNPAVAIRKNW